jgi:hypothetical protein
MMIRYARVFNRNDFFRVFPDEKDIRWDYVSFELFIYLLFHLEILLYRYQNASIRRQLFFYVVENVRKTLKMKIEQYYFVLQLRMVEYGSIEVDTELEPDRRAEKHLNHFLDNLAYAIYSQDLYQWKGATKPMPTLDIMKFSTVRSLYNDRLRSIYHAFTITHTNLFQAKSDFTRLSDEDLATIRRTTRKEIAALTS